MKSRTRNKLTDLNDHLFEQLERLNDDSLTDDQLTREMQRAESMTRISQTIVANASVILKAAKFADERIDLNNKAPEMLLGEVSDER